MSVKEVNGQNPNSYYVGEDRLKNSRQIYAVHRGLERRASSSSGDLHVGASPTSSEVGVSQAVLTVLEDRLFAVRECALRAAENFLPSSLQNDHTCLDRFLTGRSKVTWPLLPSGILPEAEGGLSESFKKRRAITKAAA